MKWVLQIRPIERDDGERFYLSLIAKDQNLQTDDQRAAAHPRYNELATSKRTIQLVRLTVDRRTGWLTSPPWVFAEHGAAATPEPKPTMRSRLISTSTVLKSPTRAASCGLTSFTC